VEGIWRAALGYQDLELEGFELSYDYWQAEITWQELVTKLSRRLLDFDSVWDATAQKNAYLRGLMAGWRPR
jgi:hypothetical protein